MPYVEISLFEGRSDELKEELIENVSNCVAETLSIDLNHVIVKLDEMDKRHYAIAGISANKKARIQAAEEKGDGESD